MLLTIGDSALDALLAQDAPTGNLTTHALGIGRVAGRITFAARADMVLCCAEEAARMLERDGVMPTRPLAAAGGVNEANAAAYAATGCGVLVTSAPYFSGPADVKVVISAIKDFAGERS